MIKSNSWTTWKDRRFTDNKLEIANAIDKQGDMHITISDRFHKDTTIYLDTNQLKEIKNHIDGLLRKVD